MRTFNCLNVRLFVRRAGRRWRGEFSAFRARAQINALSQRPGDALAMTLVPLSVGPIGSAKERCARLIVTTSTAHEEPRGESF